MKTKTLFTKEQEAYFESLNFDEQISYLKGYYHGIENSNRSTNEIIDRVLGDDK